MNQVSRCQSLLGTLVSVDVVADASDELIIASTESAFESVRSVEKRFSFHDRNSELSQINCTAHIIPFVLSSMANDLLKWSLELSAQSDGLFDISVAPLLINDQRLPNHWPEEKKVAERNLIDYRAIELSQGRVKFRQPMALDFGGVAKGLAVDLALNSIESSLQGCLMNAVVNAGGDMRIFDWQKQQVGIVSHENNMVRHDMKAAAVASSSGYYQNGISEIYHPKNKNATLLNKTISVFAENCQLADALTKVATLDSKHRVFSRYQAEVIIT